jgi:hypothetical protein
MERGEMATAIRRLAAAMAVLAALTVVHGGVRATRALAQTSPVQGTVYLDAGDGVRSDDDPGRPGVTVTAFDGTGAVVGTTITTATGQWSLAVPGPVRLEFGVAAPYQPAPLDPGLGGSTTQFADPGDIVDLAVWDTSAAREPVLGLPNYSFGPAGLVAGHPAILEIPWTARGDLITDELRTAAGIRTVASDNAVGAVFGMAPDPARKGWFAAAYMKRHVGIVDTPGTIFRIGPDGDVAVFHRLAAGADTHPADDAPEIDWLYDRDTWDAPGKVGIGDLDLGPDRTELYAINLATQSLARIPIADPAATTEIAVPVAPGCATGDWRPFGLGIDGSGVLVGAVCSKQSDQVADDNFRGHVLRFDPATNGFSTLLSFRLDYPRKCASTSVPGRAPMQNTDETILTNDPDDVCNQSTFPAANGRFEPWLPVDGTTVQFESRSEGGGAFQQSPMIGDLDITPEGNMTIGIRGRFGDQTGSPAYSLHPEETKQYEGVAPGDILLACPVGGVWQLESNARCGTLSGSGPDNREGPGGGEFYADDDTFWHDQTYYGSVVMLPNGEFATTAMDPVAAPDIAFDLGLNMSNTATGVAADSYLILYDEAGIGAGPEPHPDADRNVFAKANGLGDLELLAEAFSVELGNRVWTDMDRDGVQDPGEPSIGGLDLTLTCGASAPRTTTTDADGVYVFRNLEPSAVCSIAVPLGQPQLAGMSLTKADAVSAAADCAGQGDSDARLTAAGDAAVIDVAVGAAGANNHDCDLGFAPAPAPCLGDVVIIDENRNGIQDPGEPGIVGVVVRLVDATGAAVPAVPAELTDGQGRYLFCGLTAGVPYGVRFEYPPGYLVAPLDQGADEAVDCDGDAAGNVSPVVLGAVEINVDLDGCVLRPLTAAPGCIGDRVVSDTDRDGIQDPGEPGVPGITVHLTDGAGADLGVSTVTGPDGTYLFCDLAPGSYGVRIVYPSGAIVSARNQGTDEAVDCDSDSTGRIAPITLAAGGSDLTLDACIVAAPIVPAPAVLAITGTAQGRLLWLALALLEFGLIVAALAAVERRGASGPSRHRRLASPPAGLDPTTACPARRPPSGP